jgi:hypothetical protein
MARSLTHRHESIGSPWLKQHTKLGDHGLTGWSHVSQPRPFCDNQGFGTVWKTMTRSHPLWRITDWTMFDSFPGLKFGEKQWVAKGNFMTLLFNLSQAKTKRNKPGQL